MFCFPNTSNLQRNSPIGARFERKTRGRQEQAARSLGANAVQTFWRVTLPGIKWAVVYGVVLSLARSLGEFGAVKIVSGNLAGRTQTLTLLVEEKYQNFEQASAYSIAALLAITAIICLIIVSILRPKEDES